MSHTEQFQQIKSLDQPVNQILDKQSNLSSGAYGADALNDWKKTFSNGKEDHMLRMIKPDIDINKPFTGTISEFITEKPQQSGKLNKLPSETITLPTKEEQDGLPEFRTRPSDTKKDGIDYLKDKAKEFFGVGNTMHDRVKELVVAGLTPEQRAAYLKEEKEWKESLASNGPYNPELENLRRHPQGPMHDIVNKLTLAAEQKMSAQAKQGMSPVDRLQAERGVVSGDSNPQSDAYQQKLLAILNGFESKGEMPKGFVPQPNAREVAKALEPKKNYDIGVVLPPMIIKDPSNYSTLKSW